MKVTQAYNEIYAQIPPHLKKDCEPGSFFWGSARYRCHYDVVQVKGRGGKSWSTFGLDAQDGEIILSDVAASLQIGFPEFVQAAGARRLKQWQAPAQNSAGWLQACSQGVVRVAPGQTMDYYPIDSDKLLLSWRMGEWMGDKMGTEAVSDKDAAVLLEQEYQRVQDLFMPPPAETLEFLYFPVIGKFREPPSTNWFPGV